MSRKVKINVDIESEIIKKVIEYIIVNNHDVQALALWFREESNSCGAILMLLRISGEIVWINRFSQNEYIGGMMLYPNNQDKDIITDIIFDNIFTIESEIFKFISFASIDCGQRVINEKRSDEK